jgi:hypothetical protein
LVCSNFLPGRRLTNFSFKLVFVRNKEILDALSNFCCSLLKINLMTIYPFLIHLASLGPGVYSTSNRNQFWDVECGWCIELTTLPLSVSRLSRQCGILDISQAYRPPRRVKGIALLFYFYGNSFTFLLLLLYLFVAKRRSIWIAWFVCSQKKDFQEDDVRGMLEETMMVCVLLFTYT